MAKITKNTVIYIDRVKNTFLNRIFYYLYIHINDQIKFIYKNCKLDNAMSLDNYFKDVRSALDFIKINFPYNKWEIR